MDSTSEYIVLLKPILFKTSHTHSLIPSTHLLTARRKCSTTVYKDLSRNHGYLVDQYTINNTCIPAYSYPGWTEAR